uniref:TGF-beta family profile domain-containing protein n=1 Tax=Romanomermis culicivorax TaxID=13658 RepID=A0A915JMU6_ROMCU
MHTLLIICILCLALPTGVNGAGCCGGRHKRNAAESEQQGPTPNMAAKFMQDVGQLDWQYKDFLAKSILKTMRFKRVPERAEFWRRQSRIDIMEKADVESQDDREKHREEEEDEAEVRRYTLNVVGTPTNVKESYFFDNKTYSCRKYKFPHKGLRSFLYLTGVAISNKKYKSGVNDDELDSGSARRRCQIFYNFHIDLIGNNSNQGQIFDTLLEKAEVAFFEGKPRDPEFSAVGGRSFFEHETTNFIFQGVHLLQKHDSQQKVNDVTSLVEPLWSSSKGANFSAQSSLHLVSRYEGPSDGQRTILGCREEEIWLYEGTLRRRVTFKKALTEKQWSQGRVPVLRLQLKEIPSRRIRNKRERLGRDRNINRFDTRSSSHNRHRSMPSSVIDCEAQWDAAFFQSINDSDYSGLMPCCRRRVKINFADLGWDSWVVSPRTFDAFYCIGRCSSFGGAESSPNDEMENLVEGRHNGAAFYAEMMNSKRKSGVNLAPCCSPVKYAPLSIKVLAGVDEEVTQIVENLIVQRCGCM